MLKYLTLLLFTVNLFAQQIFVPPRPGGSSSSTNNAGFGQVNTTQFSTNNNILSITNGAAVTNLTGNNFNVNDPINDPATISFTSNGVVKYTIAYTADPTVVPGGASLGVADLVTGVEKLSFTLGGIFIGVDGQSVTNRGVSLTQRQYQRAFTNVTVATNSTVNSNIVVSIHQGEMELYLTNNISLTNFVTAAGISASVCIRVIPTSINRTIVWPTLGAPSFGIYFTTNQNFRPWTTLTQGVFYKFCFDFWGTNVDMSQYASQ